jgi:hypothetical protein
MCKLLLTCQVVGVIAPAADGCADILRAGAGDRCPQQAVPQLPDIPDEAFPLFLSSKQWLAMLDASVPEPFLK